jgi:hypothetical protein
MTADEIAQVLADVLERSTHIATLRCHLCGWSRYVWQRPGQTVQSSLERWTPDLQRHLEREHQDTLCATQGVAANSR